MHNNGKKKRRCNRGCCADMFDDSMGIELRAGLQTYPGLLKVSVRAEYCMI